MIQNPKGEVCDVLLLHRSHADSCGLGLSDENSRVLPLPSLVSKCQFSRTQPFIKHDHLDLLPLSISLDAVDPRQ